MADLMTMLLVLGGFAAAYVFYFWVLIKVSEWDGSSETKRYIARLESHLGLTEDDDLWDSPETELRKAEFLRERYSDDLFSNRLATFVYYPWSAFYLIRAFALLIAYLAVAWVAFDEGAYVALLVLFFVCLGQGFTNFIVFFAAFLTRFLTGRFPGEPSTELEKAKKMEESARNRIKARE